MLTTDAAASDAGINELVPEFGPAAARPVAVIGLPELEGVLVVGAGSLGSGARNEGGGAGGDFPQKNSDHVLSP